MGTFNGILSNYNVDRIKERIESMEYHILKETEFTLRHEVYIDKGVFSYNSFVEGENKDQYSVIRNNEWTMIFDGDVYNIEQIKRELNNKLFKNDNEIILLYIILYGIEEFLKKIEGVFSIILHNDKTTNTYLIRDHLGVKPLYYSVTEQNQLIFSSDINGILGSGLIQPKMQEGAIDEYLGNRYIRPPFTFFKNIYQVEPAEIITFDLNFNKFKKKYWNLPNKFNIEKQFKENLIQEKFHIKLLEAINKRLTNEDLTGAYLSGGVDSSLLTAIATIILDRSIDTFTIGFDQLNEFDYSNIVVKKYNCNHREFKMNLSEFMDLMEEIISIKGAPLGVPNEIPLTVMSRKMKKYISSVLSGEGADELLAGYGRIYRAPFEYRKKEHLDSFYDYFIDKYDYTPRKIRNQYINGNHELRNYFDEKIKRDFAKYSNEHNVFRFFHKYHVQGLLQRLDLATRSVGLVTKTPFLDHKLIEYVYEYVPYAMKLRWLNSEAEEKAYQKEPSEYSEILDIPKYVLKKTAEDYLPNKVLYRRKVGFPVPLQKEVNDLRDLAKVQLKDSCWIQNGNIDGLLDSIKQTSQEAQLIWMLINIELFRSIYFSEKWTW